MSHPHLRRLLPALGGLAGGAALVLPMALPAGAAPAVAVERTAAGVAVESAPVATDETSLAVGGVDRAVAGALGVPTSGAAAPAVLTREIAADPFELVAVTWEGAPSRDVAVQVRVREESGWSAWTALEQESGGPTPGTDEYERSRKTNATEPLLTEGADAVQVRVDAPAGVRPHDVEVTLVDGGTGAAAAAPSAAPSAAPLLGATATTSSLQPAVITRAEWGADESLARGSSQNSVVKAMTVHHTASSNGYSTTAQAMSQLRSIYAYHTKTLGWSDIGYHFVVDKFGNVYEGRRGSLTSRPVGAHSSGFNTDTMGISALGNYEEARPTSAMVTSIARVAAWKLGEQGLDPLSTTTLTSAGGTSRFSRGTTATLPRIFRHLDVGYTACPGQYLSAAMSSVRQQASSAVKAHGSAPVPVPTPPPAPSVRDLTGGHPLVGDWDGDGHDQLGWWKDGEVSLRMSATSTVRYRYGAKGDLPVVGDWNGDGKETVGLYRRGDWLLKNSASGGGPDRVLRFGSAADTPVVGRWGGRATGIGVVTPSSRWLLRGSVSGGNPEKAIQYGRAGDEPVVGDWDGNGKDTPGVRRGRLRILLASQDPAGPKTTLAFGLPTDRSIAGHLDRGRGDSPAIARGGLFAWRDDLRGGPALASIRYVG